MDKFRVFVYMLMMDASLKQRIPCIMRISIFEAFSVGKKCALYTGKYGNDNGSYHGLREPIRKLENHYPELKMY